MRDIIRFLWRARRWLIFGALVGILLGYAVSARRSSQYTTQAIVRFTLPGDSSLPLSQWAQVLETREWLMEHLAQKNDGLRFQASSPANSPFIYLKVTAPTPEEAQAWAQRWGEAVVEWALQDQKRRLQVLEQAEQEARQKYEQAQQQLLAFLDQDLRPGLQLTKQQLERQRSCSITRLHYYELLYQDLQDWSQRQTQQQLLDLLSVLALQQRTLGSPPCGGEANLILQITPQEVQALTPQEKEQQLANLQEFVRLRLQEEEQLFRNLEAQLRQIQRQLEEEERKALELRVARDQAWEEWQSLQRQLEKAYLNLQLSPRAVLEVPPTTPEQQLNPPLPVALLLGGVLGSIAGTVLYGLANVWREVRQEEISEEHS